MSVSAPAKSELQPTFARHETFHPRYGWLKKGFDAAGEDGAVFNRKDATTRLGVGKNMVRAIRYWCLAYKILEEERSEDNPRLFDLVPSEFGKQLLADDGWDPYLEDPGSLWLLHWNLLRYPCRAPAWWAIFNSPYSPEFSDGALLDELRRFRDEQGWTEVADNSLDKDVRCLLRMYGSATQGRDLLEDSVDSPFAELGLIRPIPGDTRAWSVNSGAKQGLPDEIVVYACLDYAIATESGAKLLGVAGLARNEGSPGRAFALTETALGDALARFAEEHETIELTHAAGNRQLVLPEACFMTGELETVSSEIRESILNLYYDRRWGAKRR
jgi:Protein of unknown function (DUF4007)